MKAILTLTLLVFTGCAQAPISSERRPAAASDTNCSSVPVANASLFAGCVPVEFSMSGEFDRIAQAHRESAGSDDAKTDPKFSTEVKVGVSSNLVYPGQARARGRTSATDSEFPKLRVELDRSADVPNSVFENARTFRINTHVSTHPKSTYTKDYGRLNDERSPYREAMVYEMARALGLAAPATRRARITYTDTQLKTTFTRNALLIETDKKMAERYGAKISKDFPQRYTLPTRQVALFHLFQVLISNGDFALVMSNEPKEAQEKYRVLDNAVVMDLPGGEQIAAVYDFDLAGMVADWDRDKEIWKPDPNFKHLATGRTRMKSYLLANLRARVSKETFEQALADFQARESVLREVVQKSQVDEAGRKNALEELDAFDQSVSGLSHYPMLLKNDVQFCSDVKCKLNPLRFFIPSGRPGTLRAGTPISVLKDGPMVKVAILDYKNDLDDDASNIGYINKKDLVLGFDLPEGLRGIVDERDIIQTAARAAGGTSRLPASTHPASGH